MRAHDRFQIELALGDWLYTVAVGIAIGLLVASLVVGNRSGKLRRVPALAVGLSGFGLLGAIGLLAYDAGPFVQVAFRLKPYLSEVSDAALLMLALVLGAASSGLLVLGASRFGRGGLVLVAVIGICVLVVGALLWQVDDYTVSKNGRHPAGTDTSAPVAARVVITGLDVPTGVSVAENGDFAVVEFITAMFRLYKPEGDGFREFMTARLPIPNDRLGFHVAFHPDYPAQPYVYISSEAGSFENRTLQILRARVDGTGTSFTPVIEGLPAARVEEGGDHFGSAITFCEGFLFVTTGDTEAEAVFDAHYENPEVHRDEAQDLSSARGKVLRWRLDGIELSADGLTGSEVPIFALGFRNPFGISCDPETGNPVVAENGNHGHDQIRSVPPGSNHEWPTSQERDLFRRPLLDSGDVHLAPTGVAYRPSPTGSHELVVTAFKSEAVYLLPVADSGTAGRLRLLVEVEGGAYGVTADSRGCTYFASADSIWRLEDGRCVK